ncbi:MAG: ATP-binding cassette domain-containing protein [Candidatus Bathyarchaeia archaeon]|jgi:ABC-2 type transport system ATP-binding protein|nr:ATP-binding cassette domain-containing protein [Candidatus Bathyarchaeota archaeon]
MSEITIATKELTKNFGNFTAVDGVNLEIPKGQLFGLLGPNGAGKTTLVRMLCTLLEPSEGTAEIAGYDIVKDASEVRKRIGVVSDGVSLYQDLTIEENLKLFSTLYDLPNSMAEDRMQNLLEMFNFKEKSKRLVGKLSSGWIKKAMIIAALIHDPKILFLDEVTSGLDPQSALALREFTRKLCDEGVTVIWTTHYMTEPEIICDKVGIIFEGRLIQIGTPKELRSNVSKQSVLEIETPNLAKSTLKKIEEVGNICKVTYDDPILKTSCIDEGDKQIEESVTKILLDSGARITAINTKEPTLEEAFISLTGGEEEIDRFMEKAHQKE